MRGRWSSHSCLSCIFELCGPSSLTVLSRQVCSIDGNMFHVAEQCAPMSNAPFRFYVLVPPSATANPVTITVLCLLQHFKILLSMFPVEIVSSLSP